MVVTAFNCGSALDKLETEFKTMAVHRGGRLQYSIAERKSNIPSKIDMALLSGMTKVFIPDLPKFIGLGNILFRDTYPTSSFLYQTPKYFPPDLL